MAGVSLKTAALTDPSKESGGAAAPREPAVGYVHTNDFPAFLEQHKISLLVSTYQAQRIMTFAPNGKKLFMLMRCFDRPTGMALYGKWLALCAKREILFFDGSAQLRDLEGKALPYDVCWVPRTSHITGDALAHECVFLPPPAAGAPPELVFVNTRFSCLSKLSPEFSFLPFWRPPFIDAILPEDRCHLNGIAADGSGIRFLTALAETNVKEGWREKRRDGGVIIDYKSGEIVARGLCMPHSPRIHAGRLWVLESGTGELLVIDPKTGARTTAAKLPGYLRGLAFHEHFAFIGTCKIREKHHFGGLPIEESGTELTCGIHVLDLRSGAPAGFIQFTKGIEELFDVKVLPGAQNPHILGFEEETINGVFVTP